jgi:hypothetical protein
MYIYIYLYIYLFIFIYILYRTGAALQEDPSKINPTVEVVGT